MKAFAYLRVSGKGQLDGDGFTRQSLAIEKYSNANGIELIATFPELGVTGEAFGEDRPAWTAMLEQCAATGVSCILIEKLDRLARDVIVQETLLSNLLIAEVTIVSTCEPDLCATDPTRVMIRQMLGVFARFEKAQLKQKLRGARERKKQQTGRCEGQKPYGNRPGETETIAWMRDWYGKAGSYRQVALELNARGVLGRHGGNWTPQLVARVLRRGQLGGGSGSTESKA